MVGAVFLSEGLQKFLFSDSLGAGRFAKIGLPNPAFLGPFVGTFEVICGTLILLGLLTRLAAVPLIIIMLVAMATTKVKSWRVKVSGKCCTPAARIGQCCLEVFSYY